MMLLAEVRTAKDRRMVDVNIATSEPISQVDRFGGVES